jgi:phosphatidylserine decarboxylase
MSIEYWSRRHNRVETEAVYGDLGVRLLYGNPLGFALTDSLLVRKSVSRFYGALQGRNSSSAKIAPFIARFGVRMEDFEPGPFRSFNDFFIRRFKPGKRAFPREPGIMGAPCEARYYGFASLGEHATLPVKGMRLDAEGVLKETPGAERFRGGPCLLARLCPVDYHRFHFPDAGRVAHEHLETGALHSVNPLALQRKPDLFLHNERAIALLDTERFGRLAYVEVGAMMVGKIVQTHDSAKPFARGEEKGYFLFGGSTVIVYGEKGAWTPEKDLLENTSIGREVLVELGEPIARSLA